MKVQKMKIKEKKKKNKNIYYNIRNNNKLEIY